MPCPCLARTCRDKACRVHTLPVSGRALPLLHTSEQPRDNCPVLPTVSPAPTAPPVVPVGPLCHTICALHHCLCSRQRLHRALWLDASAPLRFPASRLCGSTVLPSSGQRQHQSRVHR